MLRKQEKASGILKITPDAFEFLIKTS